MDADDAEVIANTEFGKSLADSVQDETSGMENELEDPVKSVVESITEQELFDATGLGGAKEGKESSARAESEPTTNADCGSENNETSRAEYPLNEMEDPSTPTVLS